MTTPRSSTCRAHLQARHPRRLQARQQRRHQRRLHRQQQVQARRQPAPRHLRHPLRRPFQRLQQRLLIPQRRAVNTGQPRALFRSCRAPPTQVITVTIATRPSTCRSHSACMTSLSTPYRSAPMADWISCATTSRPPGGIVCRQTATARLPTPSFRIGHRLGPTWLNQAARPGQTGAAFLPQFPGPARTVSSISNGTRKFLSFQTRHTTSKCACMRTNRTSGLT